MIATDVSFALKASSGAIKWVMEGPMNQHSDSYNQ